MYKNRKFMFLNHVQFFNKLSFNLCKLKLTIANVICTRQVSSMIHSARPIFTRTLFSVIMFSKFESGRTDVRTTCAKTMFPTGLDFGLAEWIN